MIIFTTISCSEDSMKIEPQILKLEINSTERYYNQKLIEYRISDNYGTKFTFDKFITSENNELSSTTWVIYKDQDKNDYYIGAYLEGVQKNITTIRGSTLIGLYKTDNNVLYKVKLSIQKSANGNKIYSNEINY